MTQGFGGFLLLLGCGWGCGEGVCSGFRFFPFCLQVIMKIKILNSIKTVPEVSVESLSAM